MKWLFGVCACVMGLSAAFAADDGRPDWGPSKFGPDDRLGAMNYLTPEKTAAAAKLITTGKTYALGMVTGRTTPAYPPRKYDVIILQLDDGTGTPVGANGATANDDMVETFNGIGSQIDGLGHFGKNHYYYNGVHASEFVATDGLKQFGIDTLPPVATRGVLLDITKAYDGVRVPDGVAINKAEIDAAMKRAGVMIEQGDVVLLHTGNMAATAGDTTLAQTVPGLGVEGAQYLAGLGVVAVGTDTWALDVIPFENEGSFFEVHQILLTQNGVYLLENMVTAELAADGVTEFFFTLGAPRLEGTVQGIINPVAIR